MADPISEFTHLVAAHLRRPPETRPGGDIDLVTVPTLVKGTPTQYRATATCLVFDISAATVSSHSRKQDAKRAVFQLLLLEAGRRGFAHQSLPSDGKYHHACPVDARASLPDVALGSLSPAEFARDWTTTTRGRLFQDTEAVHPAGSPVPGRVPIRNAPDTPDPMRVDTGVASPKWLRINLGGASSVGSPIGRTGPALTHPAQVSTVAQLQDSVFVAGEYPPVEGRVVRASDFRRSQ
jgi:hypothetical protein